MSYLRVYLSAGVACLAEFTSGMMMGWTLPYIREGTGKTVSPNEALWIMPFLEIGGILGCIISMWIVDAIGRRTTMMLTILPALISWLLVANSTGILDVCMSRLFGGIVRGMVLVSGSMYLTEIAPANIRGTLTSCFISIGYVGGFVAYVIGTPGSKEIYSYVAIVFSFLYIVLFLWLPESPYHLLRCKQYTTSMDSLMFFRGGPDIAEEMDSIVRTVECDPQKEGTCWHFRDLISRSGGKKIIFIGISMTIVQAISGSSILFDYMRVISSPITRVDGAPKNLVDEMNFSIIFIIIYIISYLLCMALVDRFGRRPLMYLSAIGTAVSLILLVYYFWTETMNHDTTNGNFLAFLGIILHISFVSLGLICVPILVISEIFPMYAKATYVSLCLALNFLWQLAILEVWNIAVRQHVEFIFFSVLVFLNVLAALFVVFCVPETKRMTLLQIQKNVEYPAKK